MARLNIEAHRGHWCITHRRDSSTALRRGVAYRGVVDLRLFQRRETQVEIMRDPCDEVVRTPEMLGDVGDATRRESPSTDRARIDRVTQCPEVSDQRLEGRAVVVEDLPIGEGRDTGLVGLSLGHCLPRRFLPNLPRLGSL